MVITKQDKFAKSVELSSTFKSAKSVALISFKGLGIAALTELRRSLFENGINLEVIKTTVVQKALEKAGLEVPESIIGQPVGVVVSQGDDIKPFKLVADFSKSNEQVSTLAGIFEGATITSAEAVAIAKLPGINELRAQLVGVLAGIPARLVHSLRWNGMALTSVLKQHLASK